MKFDCDSRLLAFSHGVFWGVGGAPWKVKGHNTGRLLERRQSILRTNSRYFRHTLTAESELRLF
jgi:hypothetical protein